MLLDIAHRNTPSAMMKSGRKGSNAAFQRGRFKYILPVGRGIHPGRSEAPEFGGEELYVSLS